ncbi:hypothetical protein BsWGS_02036 [Bradybaena similaris]
MARTTGKFTMNTLGAKQAAALAVCVLIFSLASAGQEAPHCSSTFHVWQPGQEAQQMIRDTYLKMDNLTSYTKYEIAEVRVHVAQEVSRIQNWTYAIDKRIVQLQMNKMDEELLQMKFTAGSTKVQTQLEQVSRRVDDLERSMFSIRSKLRSGRSSSSSGNVEIAHGHHYNIPQQQGLSTDIAATLRNSVGDLKAEWILLKREVESLKKENIVFLKTQQELQNSTASFKGSMEKAAMDTKALEMKVYEMDDKQDRMDVKMDRMLAECEQLNLMLDQYKAEVSQYEANVASLQTTSTSLRNELNEVHIRLANVKEPSAHQRGQQQHDTTESKVQLLPLSLPEQNHNVDWTVPESSKERASTASSERPRTGVREHMSSPEIMKDCHEIYQAGFRVSSVYQILPVGARYMIPVYCEMINNTGYTLIQRRVDGTINFNRRWSEYQQGFGNPYGEQWLGNDLIHLLTKQKQYTLRIDFWDWEGEQYYAEYARFYVEGANEHYKLTVGEFTGNAGDSFAYHNEMAFSTEDMDNDLHERHCAAENKAGWWYNSCFYSQLNGIYHTAWYSQSQSNYPDGIVWFTLKDNEFYSLRRVEMKLKPNKSGG